MSKKGKVKVKKKMNTMDYETRVDDINMILKMGYEVTIKKQAAK